MAEATVIENVAKSLFTDARGSLPIEDYSAIEQDTQLLDEYIDSMVKLASAVNGQFQLEILRARRRLNSMRAIYTIPDEILAYALNLTMEYSLIDDQSGYGAKLYCRQRTNLQLVCQKWRSTVRGSAQFWDFVSSMIPSRVNNRSLKLSQQRLLQCRSDQSTSSNRNDQFWSRLMPHLHRFGAISAFPSKTVLDMVSGGIENLLKLRLRAENGDPPKPFVIAPSLVAPWPRLQHLYLNGMSTPWSRPLVSNLISLSLHSIVGLPVGVLIEILRHSPQLEVFEITGGLATSDSLIVRDSTKVLLSSLRKLILTELDESLFTTLVNIIEPKALDSLHLSTLPFNSLPPSEPVETTEFRDLPHWTVVQGANLLLLNNSVAFANEEECCSQPHGFLLTIQTKRALTWLAKVLDQVPSSTPPIKVACDGFTVETLNYSLGMQLNRCELSLANIYDKDPERVQYLCQRDTMGSFVLPTLVELSIHLGDETSSDIAANLLEERYRKPLRVLPLRKLVYTTRGEAPSEVFVARLEPFLQDCNIEWRKIHNSFRCGFGMRNLREDNTGYTDDETESSSEF